MPKDDQAERLRCWARAILTVQFDGKVQRWTKKAGVRESTLRNFLKGASNSLTSRTQERLGDAAGVPSPGLGGRPSVVVEGQPVATLEGLHELAERVDKLTQAVDEILTVIRQGAHRRRKSGARP